MKMLLFHVSEFWYRTHRRNLESEEERVEEGGMDRGGVLAWIQVENIDLERFDSVVRKATKNLKWHARKVEESVITLHSFAHLSDDHAEPEQAERLLAEIGKRLRSVGFEVRFTPWGHFNEFRMHVNGPSLAKVFKEI